MMQTNKFRDELASLINRNCMENGSDTPDFILAEYLTNCLTAFDTITLARDKWYGFQSLTARIAALPGAGAAALTPVERTDEAKAK